MLSTETRQKIFEMHKSGASNREIAKALSISENTVSKYLQKQSRSPKGGMESFEDMNKNMENIINNLDSEFSKLNDILGMMAELFTDKEYGSKARDMASQYGIFYGGSGRKDIEDLIKYTTSNERKAMLNLVRVLHKSYGRIPGDAEFERLIKLAKYSEAELKRDEKIIEAVPMALSHKDSLEKEIKELNTKIAERENQLRAKEDELEDKEQELEYMISKKKRELAAITQKIQEAEEFIKNNPALETAIGRQEFVAKEKEYREAILNQIYDRFINDPAGVLAVMHLKKLIQRN
ncbi:MAG: helix-turn-helix domain-containing protein [Candidatus Parvarchaeota archaeon]